MDNSLRSRSDSDLIAALHIERPCNYREFNHALTSDRVYSMNAFCFELQ